MFFKPKRWGDRVRIIEQTMGDGTKKYYVQEKTLFGINMYWINCAGPMSLAEAAMEAETRYAKMITRTKVVKV